jgi:23S rRNA (pseudouridine1915-N3)-methyltransferase
MKLSIIACGVRMPAWVDAAFDDYVKRMPRDWPVSLIAIKPAPRERTLAQILAHEGARILAASEGATLIALDERGETWSTAAFAQRLARWHDSATDVAFAIGSADGLDATVKARAAHVLRLSAFTLPHGLARVLLAEQLYRAWSVIAGHPYHRA